MTISAVTLTNPGGETGDTTGWTSRSGGVPAIQASGANSVASHSGSYYLCATASGSTAVWDQQIAVDPLIEAAIDSNLAAVLLQAWHTGFTDSDSGALYAEAYAGDGTTLLDSNTAAQSDPAVWTQEGFYFRLPVGTRFIRIGTTNVRHTGTQLSAYWDDFTLDISDDRFTDWPATFTIALEGEASESRVRVLSDGTSPEAEVSGVRVRTIYSFPAQESNSSLNQVRALWSGSGGVDGEASLLFARILIKFGLDSRKLRAWTFTQDDHDFYVLQLGGDITLIYDKLTQQWAQWRSPSYTFWRGNDGVQWEGWNICCDTQSGILWEIDADGRLDNGITPITSIMYGGFTKRFRAEDPCYMAELALSESRPPSGVDAGDVSITLRTSDDGGLTYLTHGEIPSTAIGEEITVRWYGLGLMNHPNKIFEITDTGYARRIDGLDVEIKGV